VPFIAFSQRRSAKNALMSCYLQGHIGVDTSVFPENTPGFVLDAFARASLWKIGLDYRHGYSLSKHFEIICGAKKEATIERTAVHLKCS